MRTVTSAIGACVCLAAFAAATTAQSAPLAAEPGAINTYGLSLNPDDTLDMQIYKLLGRWKTTKVSSDRHDIEKELRGLLQKQFQARLDLEAKVKSLQGQVPLRREKQDEIIDFRLQQLLREAQGLGWGGGVSGPGMGGGGMGGGGMGGGGMGGGGMGGGVAHGGRVAGNAAGMGFGGGMAGRPAGGLGGGATETATPRSKGLSLESGTYMLALDCTTEERTAGGRRSSQMGGMGPVEVMNEDGKITIRQPNGTQIVGELRNNEFSGTMSDARGMWGGPVKLEGKLTANDEVSGKVLSESKNGPKTSKGTFKLVRNLNLW